eukprot:s485_g17.t1
MSKDDSLLMKICDMTAYCSYQIPDETCGRDDAWGVVTGDSSVLRLQRVSGRGKELMDGWEGKDFLQGINDTNHLFNDRSEASEPTGFELANQTRRSIAFSSQWRIVGDEAVSRMSNIEVNDAFAKRMAQVQAELEQMQKVQNELKGQEARYLKAVQGYQKDLETIARQIGHAQTRRLETARKMCEITTEAERVRSEKLNAASETLHLPSKPTMAPSNPGVNLCDLLAEDSSARGPTPSGASGALDLLQLDPGIVAQAPPWPPQPNLPSGCLSQSNALVVVVEDVARLMETWELAGVVAMLVVAAVVGVTAVAAVAAAEVAAAVAAVVEVVATAVVVAAAVAVGVVAGVAEGVVETVEVAEVLAIAEAAEAVAAEAVAAEAAAAAAAVVVVVEAAVAVEVAVAVAVAQVVVPTLAAAAVVATVQVVAVVVGVDVEDVEDVEVASKAMAAAAVDVVDAAAAMADAAVAPLGVVMLELGLLGINDKQSSGRMSRRRLKHLISCWQGHLQGADS